MTRPGPAWLPVALVVVASLVAGGLLAAVATGGAPDEPAPPVPSTSTSTTVTATTAEPGPDPAALPAEVRDCISSAQAAPLDACVVDLLATGLSSGAGLDPADAACAARAVVDRFGLDRVVRTLDGSLPFTERERPAVAEAVATCTAP